MQIRCKSHRWTPLLGIIALTLVCAPLLTALAQKRASKPYPRAALPTWKPGEHKLIFFDDVFKEGVVGTRPVFGPERGKTVVASGNAAPEGGKFPWSRIISATTLEDEIKRAKGTIDAEVSSPARFAGTGHKAARNQFSMLAIAFGIIAEYDGDVRWRADAPAARDLFAKAAANCKVGSVQAFNEAKASKTGLEDLVGGSGLKERTVDAKANWPQVTDRGPLMQRLKLAHQERLQPWVGNAREFSNRSDELLHEAQVVAALFEVLKKEGMEDAGDAEYAAFCDRLKQAATEVSEAVKSENYERARTAVSEMGKTCTACHEMYQG